jgi:hypothetical protein
VPGAVTVIVPLYVPGSSVSRLLTLTCIVAGVAPDAVSSCSHGTSVSMVSAVVNACASFRVVATASVCGFGGLLPRV